MADKIYFDNTWKRCFELAWEAHVEGSNPIASVITDESGKIVGSGKSDRLGNKKERDFSVVLGRIEEAIQQANGS